MLAEKLKEQTTAYHQQLEKIIVYRLKSLKNKADYIKLLQLFYSYFGSLEDRINQFITIDQLPDHEQRRKAGSIAQDIAELGGHTVAKASGTDIPAIANEAQALGAMYVIEGSTLGGSIISKMVSAKLGLQQGLSFFNSYGENSHQMWGIFKGALNNQPVANEPAIIETANNTFLQFKNWIEQHG